MGYRMYDLTTSLREYICEMANPKKEILRYMSNLGPVINLHLTKLLLLNGKKKDISHWKDEIDTWVMKILNFSPKGGKITSTDVFTRWYRNPYEDSWERYLIGDIKEIRKKYPTYTFKPLAKNLEKANEIIKEFYLELSKEFITKSFSTEKLYKLIDKSIFKSEEIKT